MAGWRGAAKGGEEWDSEKCDSVADSWVSSASCGQGQSGQQGGSGFEYSPAERIALSGAEGHDDPSRSRRKAICRGSQLLAHRMSVPSCPLELVEGGTGTDDARTRRWMWIQIRAPIHSYSSGRMSCSGIPSWSLSRWKQTGASGGTGSTLLVLEKAPGRSERSRLGGDVRGTAVVSREVWVRDLATTWRR